MKRVKNSDIKFKINKKLVYLPNFVIRFYTVNQKEYFFEKTQDDLVEYEREATVDDVEVILSGGTTVTEYYLPLNWSELLFVGQGILNYKLTNNIEDPEFPDHQYNKEEVVTTDFYIDSIKVNPEPEEGLIERVVHLEEHLAEEIVNREEADTAISGAVDTEIARATSAETHLQTEITELSGTVATYDDRITMAQEDARQAFEQTEAEIARSTAAEAALDTKIDQEIADRIADVNAEEARAISAETALDAKIDAETTRATSAEAALDVNISTVSGNVISETSRATTAENALSGAIDSISAATSGSVEELDAKIDQEITDRTADVDAEEARAKGVENALSGAIDTLDVRFFDDAKYEMSGQTHVINFYNGNTVKATIDCTDFLVDGMIDNVYIENGYLVIDFNTASGKQDIRIPLTDIFNPANYYTKSETSGATEIANALALKLNISDFNTYSGAVDTAINSKASQSTVDALNGVVTAHTADDSIHFTTGAVQTQIDNSISGKADSSDVYLKTETSGATELATAFAAKQDQLIAGENITISGNVISSEGGGKAIEAGRGISITTSETADTVSFNLPISAGTGNNSIKCGGNCIATKTNSAAFGNNSSANGLNAFAINQSTANGQDSFSQGTSYAEKSSSAAFGRVNYSKNQYELSCGSYNNSVSATTTFGDSGNTLFSVGNGTNNNNRHNAFEIRQNGDIYLTKDGQDVKLQDQLGGGGTVESAITSGSTNAVESKAIWSATTYNKDVLLTFNGYNSTNYPEGCTKIKVEDITSNSYNNIHFLGGDYGADLGTITINNWGSITVDTSNFQGATYEISGSTVIISYPTVTTVTKLGVDENGRYTYKAVVEGAWISDNTYMKEEVDAIQNTLQNNINQKLDATAYTPTVVDSSLNVASTNPVENQALYSELRIGNGGETETTLVFENDFSTNYPSGCTQIKVEVVGSNNNSSIYFYNDWNNLGNVNINNYGNITVTINDLNATYEISGTTVIISYPTVTNVTKIQAGSIYVYKAVTTGAPTALKDQVVANTTALATKQNQLTAGSGISIDANNVISVTGGTGGGISSAECQTMIDNSISGKADSSDVYLKSETSGATEIATALSAKLDSTAYTPTDLSNYYTKSETSGKTEISTALASKADSSDVYTKSETSGATEIATALAAKSDFSGSYNDLTDKPTIPNYTAGSGITISNNVISAKIWSGTQAQYDALTVKDNDTIYLIYNS